MLKANGDVDMPARRDGVGRKLRCTKRGVDDSNEKTGEIAGVEHGYMTELTYPSRACISRSAFEHNLARVRQLAPTQEIMAVIKADAYGHGAERVMTWAIEAGVQWFAIAQLGEALAIREAVTNPCHILALIAQPSDDYTQALRNNIDLTVASLEQIEDIVAVGRLENITPRLHIEVDTGMARGGFDLGRLRDAASSIHKLIDQGRVEVVGLWSHLACADDPNSDFTDVQIDRFDEAREILRQEKIEPQYCHLAASSGILWHPRTHYSMVRPGIMLYGLSPNVERASGEDLDLEPVMELQADITSVRDVNAHTGVSYGHTAKTSVATQLATVPLGYGDGIARSASNIARVTLGGHSAHILGRVCMDQFVVALDDGAALCEDGGAESHDDAESAAVRRHVIHVGDAVCLFGNPRNGVFSADDWARWCNTISYEIVTRIGPRVPRISVS